MNKHIDDYVQAAKTYALTSLITPRLFSIALTGQCNMHCDYCYWKEGPDASKTDMSDQVYEQVLSAIKNAAAVNIGVLGEPTLSRHFFPFLEYCEHRRIPVEIFTNGSTMDDLLIDRLRDRRVSLVFSLDSLQAKTYQQYRHNNLLPGLLTRIEQLTASPWPRVRLSVCIDRDNYTQLPEIIRYCADHRIKAVYIHYRTYTDPVGFDRALFHIWPTWLSVKTDTTQLAQSLGVELLFSADNLDTTGVLCNHTVLTIDHHGNVYPCCFRFGLPMGSLANSDFDTIWHSPGYTDFRHALLAKQDPPLCNHCLRSCNHDPGDPLLFFKNFDMIDQSFKALIRHINAHDIAQADQVLCRLEQILPEHTAIRYYQQKIQGAAP